MGVRNGFFQQMNHRRVQSAADLAKMSREAQMIAPPPTLDRMGNPIERGDLVVNTHAGTPVYQVLGKRILPPQQPGGAPVVEFILGCQFPFRAFLGQPLQDLFVVGSVPQEPQETKPDADPSESAAPAPLAGDGQVGDTDRRDEDPGGDGDGRGALVGAGAEDDAGPH